MGQAANGTVRLITWNVNGRTGGQVAAQVAALMARAPQIVALQEVRQAEAPRYLELLRQGDAGLPHGCTTADHAPRGAAEQPGGRKVLIVASRWPLERLPEPAWSLDHLDHVGLNPKLRAAAQDRDACLPDVDTALGARVQAPGGPVEVLNAYLPHGVLHNKRKAATPDAARREDEKAAKSLRERVKKLAALASIARYLTTVAGPRLLCGDLNTTLEARSYRARAAGEGLERGLVPDDWMRAERALVQQLLRRGFSDPCAEASEEPGWPPFTWVSRQSGWEYRKHLDHVLLSPDLRPLTCRVLHDARLAGLSDHAPVDVRFAFAPAGDE